MKYRLIKLLGGYSAREYQKLETHYDVLLSLAKMPLKESKKHVVRPNLNLSD